MKLILNNTKQNKFNIRLNKLNIITYDQFYKNDFLYVGEIIHIYKLFQIITENLQTNEKDKLTQIKNCYDSLILELKKVIKLDNIKIINSKLVNVDLSESILNIFCNWEISYYESMNKTIINIGCFGKTIEEWDKFFASDTIIKTPRNTIAFKRIYSSYLAYKTYIQNMGDDLFKTDIKQLLKNT